MTKNPLLTFSLAVLFGYWLVGSLIPGQVVSTIVSLMLFSIGFVTMLRYMGPAWRIVVLRERYPDVVGRGRGGEGSYLAAYGTFLFAVGSVYAGLFTIAWMVFGDRSMAWLSTPVSSFGRFSMAIGFGLMLFSPEVTAEGLRVSRTLWVSVTVAVIVGAVAWYFGFHMGREELRTAMTLKLR
jgi:hypothetical protein